MNIYEKLQECRVELQNTDIKKTGNNKFAGYMYYELADFLPKINEMFKTHKLSSIVNFTSDTATLTIINCEDLNEDIVFTSTIAEANLKGCHAIQNLGAVQTYLRRYLYINALEITDGDVLDGTNGKPEGQNLPPKPKVSDIISPEQIKRLMTIVGSYKMTADEAKEIMAKYHYTSSTQIKKSDYDKIVKEIETIGKTKTKGE